MLFKILVFIDLILTANVQERFAVMMGAGGSRVPSLIYSCVLLCSTVRTVRWCIAIEIPILALVLLFDSGQYFMSADERGYAWLLLVASVCGLGFVSLYLHRRAEGRGFLLSAGFWLFISLQAFLAMLFYLDPMSPLSHKGWLGLVAIPITLTYAARDIRRAIRARGVPSVH